MSCNSNQRNQLFFKLKRIKKMTNLKFNGVYFCLAFILTLVLSFSTGQVSAQSSCLNCTEVETEGNASSGLLTLFLNGKVSGYEYRISRRKKLVFSRVSDVRFKGCKAYATFHVTLKRKLRRDAKGYVKAKATVFNRTSNKVYLKDLDVYNVSMSNTLEIGESIYTVIARRKVPSKFTLNL